uniref:Uncharacterized protein n=1 Tax=Picea glauca TaxID=3330 RepID=A0A101LZQ6_PICGL|nr:hypothetical protein ABT39_MTgene5239 [Picea glauca]QHR89170.1 hypothetical protein Q903MT_gene3190 [Picea sitchensis]
MGVRANLPATIAAYVNLTCLAVVGTTQLPKSRLGVKSIPSLPREIPTTTSASLPTIPSLGSKKHHRRSTEPRKGIVVPRHPSISFPAQNSIAHSSILPI